MANGYAKYLGVQGSGGGGSGVTSLNTLTGALTLVAGSNITITPSGGNTLTIASSGGGGSGTVTSVSVTSGNGFAGTVATPTTTPALTLSTTVTGILQGNGTAISAATVGNLTESTSSVLTITGGTNAVLGSGLTLQVKQASTSQSGYLSSTDWNTFNGKQAAGNYLTALTGDGTASGPGSVALTLATVNSNVGSFTNANITVNAKGLITAASNGSAGTGTVTSVAMTVPPRQTVTGSPITSSGTLAVTDNNQNANLVFAGPSTGAAAAPTFRQLVNADMPSGSATFAQYASNIVNTDSSALTGGSFATFSNSPAFMFTPTITGNYKVYCSAPFLDGSSQFQVRVFNTSGGATLLQESQAGNSTSAGIAADASLYFQSVYTLTANTTYVFDIQGLVMVGSINLAGSTICPFYMFAEGIALTGNASAIVRSINSISSPTTAGAAAATDYVYLVSGTTTLTLPTAVSNSNLYTIKNVGANIVTISTTSAQTIDGSSTASLPVQYTSLDLISDGSNWNVV